MRSIMFSLQCVMDGPENLSIPRSLPTSWSAPLAIQVYIYYLEYSAHNLDNIHIFIIV